MAKVTRPGRKLSFRLDGKRITAEEFSRAVDAFFVLIKEVAHEVTGETKPIDWIVSVKEGSIELAATAEPRSSTIDVPRVTTAIYSGMKTLALKKTRQTRERPAYFSDLALYKAREIARVTSSKAINKAEIIVQRKRAAVQRQTALNVETILGLRQTDFGAVEGRLETVSVSGRPHFAVRDVTNGRQVQCLITEANLYQKAVPALGKRVAVVGRIRYRESGEAASVQVRDIKMLPERERLPTADEVYGILAREG